MSLIHLLACEMSLRSENTLYRELHSALLKAPEKTTFKELTDLLGPGSFAIILLIFALPNSFPSPPGIGSLLGIPIILIGLQMLKGRASPVLPQFISEYKISRTLLVRLLVKMKPVFRIISKFKKSEILQEDLQSMTRVAGLMAMIAGLVISIPLPLTNMLPSVGVLVLSVGLLQRNLFAAAFGTMLIAAGIILGGAFLIKALQFISNFA